MKKFLILLLVLGLASVTNATYYGLTFTVDGEPQPAEIWLEGPSDSIELDLELDAGYKLHDFGLDYVLSNAQAELIYDGIQFPTQFDLAAKVVAETAGPQYVRITGGQLISPSVEGPAVLMEELYVHCLEYTDVLLTIVVGATTRIDDIDGMTSIPIGTVLHELTIHQIPEPATIALLGLGGLLLRRRK